MVQTLNLRPVGWLALLISIGLYVGCYQAPTPVADEVWDLDELSLPNVVMQEEGSESQDLADKPADGTSPQPATEPSPSNPPAFLVNDQSWIKPTQLPWRADYVHHKNGRPVGFSRLDISSEFPKHQLNIIRTDWILTNVDGTPAWTESRLESTEYVTGQLREFKLLSERQGNRETIEGKIRQPDQLQLTTTREAIDAQAERSGTSVAWKPGTWGVLGIQSMLMREPMQPGEKRTGLWLIPSMQQLAEVQLIAGNRELTPLAGGTAPELLPIDVWMLTETAGEIRVVQSRNWVNEQGEIEKTLALTGPTVTTFRVTRETTDRLESAVQMERLMGQAIDLQISGGDRWDDTSPLDGVFVIDMQGIDPAQVFPKSRIQQMDSLEARSARVTVRPASVLPSPAMDAAFQETPPTPEDTATSPWIRSDHVLVKQLADKLVDATDPAAVIAEKFLLGVAEQLELSPLDAESPNAVAALNAAMGDCVDHAILLATLLRSRDIPARIVSGLKVESNATPELVFWMWTEAWIDDSWVSLDATQGAPTGRGHLAIHRDSLAGNNPYAAILPVLQRMQAIVGIRLDTTTPPAAAN